jgi:hypothetical protein
MLRSLVIASGSGLVLFEKEWTKEFELVRPDPYTLRPPESERMAEHFSCWKLLV